MSPTHSIRRLASLAALAVLASCAPRDNNRPQTNYRPRPAPDPFVAPVPLTQVPPPTGRLPADVRPTHYTLVLEIDPKKPRFSGTTEIAVDLDQPHDVLWLHGRDLYPKSVTIRAEGQAPQPCKWDQVTPAGLVAVRPLRPIGPGHAVLRVDYDASFGERQEGLFHVRRGDKDYAFTQFEATYARRAFPSFDEPSFKTPYDVTLFVPQGQEAIANTREIARSEAAGGLTRISFATTEKLPSYLLAFAVGPLDVVSAPALAPNAVRKRPLPLRGLSARGRGAELTYALAHAGEVVEALEAYTGIEFPYDKLDLIAVPEKRGAMENAGAITFGESSLLLDPKAHTRDQELEAVGIMAHELAHQWFGDLVTAAWWDDIWLNEAFATWLGGRVFDRLRPEAGIAAEQLEGVHEAMERDTLASARKIREEIRDDNDITSAFDVITYQKGGAVLGMFEKFVGPKEFQQGLNAYLNRKRFAAATEADLLTTLSEVARRDVTTPFRSFLFQTGVPLVQASLGCTPSKKAGKAPKGAPAAAPPALTLRQSPFLAIGGAGDPNRLWQIPVCARYPDGDTIKTSCTLLSGREATLPLDTATCPAWVMPNADAAGYYRFTLPAAETKRLAEAGYAKLTPGERLAFADSLRAGLEGGPTPAGEVLDALAPFAVDADRTVAGAPMGMLQAVEGWLDDEASRRSLEIFGARVYQPALKTVGWDAAAGENEGRSILRGELIAFLALTARDAGVRREAAERGRAYAGLGKDNVFHPEAAAGDLAGVALSVAVADGDAATFDALLARLAGTEDELHRSQILTALGSTTKPELITRALGLTLDPRLRSDEILYPIRTLFHRPETRDQAWKWLEANIDAVLGRVQPGRAARMMWLGASFCDRPHAEAFVKLFGERSKSIDGGPRAFAGTVEAIGLCAARRAAKVEGVKDFLAKLKPEKKRR